jgi:hypothetical protein
MQPQSLEIVAIRTDVLKRRSTPPPSWRARALALAAVIAQHSPAVRAFVVALWAT